MCRLCYGGIHFEDSWDRSLFAYYDGARPRYATMNKTSAAAERRLTMAKEAFATTKTEWEAKTDLIPHTKHTIELLQPQCHLVGDCWSRFLRHVQSHDGWAAKRRAATPAEKMESRETRKGKVYFVSVTYTVPMATKRPAEAAVTTTAKKQKTADAHDAAKTITPN